MLPERVRWFRRWYGRQGTENMPPGSPDEVKLDTIGPAFDRAVARKKAREDLQATRKYQGTRDDLSLFLPPPLDNGPLAWTTRRGAAARRIDP